MTDQLVLTRYLYNKRQVNQSLIISLLEHQTQEALFWAYELYHSGFQYFIFKFMSKIYNMFYKKDNPTLHDFILKTTNEWRADRSQDHLIGSIVHTLASRDYQIDDFVSSFVGMTINTEPTKLRRRRFIIKLKPEDVDIYRTIIMPPTENWKLLRTACLYPIRKNVNELFGTYLPTPTTIAEIYKSNRWIYYAVRSPIWEDRVLEYDCILDNETQQVIFPCGEEDGDAFYDHWGYEPDEQSQDTKLKLMGDDDEMQMTIDEFCSLYGNKQKEIIHNEERRPSYQLETLLRTPMEELANTMIFCK